MFNVPAIPTTPASLTLAHKLLESSNQQLAALATFRKEQFQEFWYSSRGQLRSREEINTILEHMDSAGPGNAARFFQAAKALVDLINAISGFDMEPEQWTPPYEYAVDPNTMQLRIVIPPEPEPDPIEEPIE